MSEEKNQVICKICKELKTKIQDGTYPNGKNKKWVDTEGKLWNGRICGQCQVEMQKEFMAVKRAKKETQNEE